VAMVGGDFDFAVLHRYTGMRKSDRDLRKPLKCKKVVVQLKHFLQSKLHRAVPIVVTEYNVSGKSGKRLSPIALSLTLGEMIGNYLESGAMISNYWPMRFKDPRAMFSLNKGEPRAPYYVFKALSNYTYDRLLKTRSDDEMLYALSSKESKSGEITLFLINKSSKVMNANIELPGNYKPIESLEIDREDLTLHLLKQYKEKTLSSKWELSLDPLSLTVVRFGL